MSSAKPKLCIIGLGMASMRLLDELVKHRATERYDIAVFSAEAPAGYNRIMLSYLLTGEQTLASVTSHTPEWFAQQGIDLHLGVKVTAMDPIQQSFTTETGEMFGYDRLVLATGSNASRIALPGVDLAGVHCFRDLQDVAQLNDLDVTDARPVMVLGAGLLGLEAAYGLAGKGHRVMVVHRSDRILSQQLDAMAGRLLQKSMEQQGIEFVLQRHLAEIQGKSQIEAVRLNHGEAFEVKALIMAVGIQPNSELAKQAGLLVNRGIVVNNALETSDSGIYALGECCELDQQTFGLVAPIYRQAAILAASLMKLPTRRFEHQLSATRLKVSGIEVFSFGDPNQAGDQLVLQDPSLGLYRKVVLVDGVIQSAILLGNTQDANWLFELHQQQIKIDNSQRSALLFGEAYYERAAA
ncbi:NAD(P)/FAD-dependent oxidoreductase [Thiomicrospira microaerophila]|uniref:NAD(P)/FAD-dependent oxidoreductase n=1 Tax=Thiomicrospira microaerophila TaxID=406020 RepID=UPI0020109E49|nr:FAD-dependent oxidoreductase [Thiomicrospira microaerophila]UQB41493.1 NAD(P)/FAD-dependent oxidoreductase [Thiomicrospira microaerophila]